MGILDAPGLTKGQADTLYANASTSVQALRRELALGQRDVATLILGDSTADAQGEWFYLSMTALATAYPAYTVIQPVWADNIQGYNPPVTIQTGTAGARVDGYANYVGAVNNYISCPDNNVGLNITGDIDIRAKVALNDWTPTADQAFAAKYHFGGQRSWRLYISASGQLNLQWSEDGTAFKAAQSTENLSAVADGATRWVRVTLDVDNGSAGNTVTFYTSVDGIIWTILGTAVTQAGVTSLFDNNYSLEIGTRSQGGADPMNGKYYQFQLRAGLDGVVVADLDFNQYVGTDTIVDFIGNVWSTTGTVAKIEKTGAPVLTCYNASASGRSSSYHAVPERLAKMAPAGRPVLLTFISHSHNENAVVAPFAGYISALADQVIARYAYTGICLMAQNPRKSPAAYIKEHLARLAQLFNLAGRRRWDIVDGYTPLAGDLANNVVSDGIHPTPAGSILWANAVKKYLGLA